MNKLKTLPIGINPTARQYNELVTAINSLIGSNVNNITSRVEITSGFKVLSATQGTSGTDSFNPLTDSPSGWQLQVITDVEYNETTHVIAYRTRTITFRLVMGKPTFNISAESDLVPIATAATCT